MAIQESRGVDSRTERKPAYSARQRRSMSALVLATVSHIGGPGDCTHLMLRRINISAASIVFVCFFLPWEQVSCGGAKDTLNGLDLARHDHSLFWLVPLLTLAVLVVGLVRRRGENIRSFAIVSIVSGGVVAYLM